MEDIYVTEHIKEICKNRGWSYYRLAKESDIPYSSLNSMLKNQHVPSMNNLIKICRGLNITLAQFFSDIPDENLSEKDEFIKLWNLLDTASRKLVIAYMYGLIHRLPEACEENA